MNRLIDIGEDKNLVTYDPNAEQKAQPQFMMEDLYKNADETVAEARKATWDVWINSEPLLFAHVDNLGKSHLFFISEAVKGKVILLDFWDYTLLQSRRALGYVQEWHHRYSSAGLIVIGVHSPVFEVGKDKKYILEAVKERSITHPVVLDNNYSIWKCFENRYWPRRILIDANGKIQKDMIGEGNYSEMEKTLQLLLREINPGLSCPPVRDYFRKTDDPNFSMPPTTPEIFLGTKRKQPIGNSNVLGPPGQEIIFKEESSGNYAPGLPYFEGAWATSAESFFGSPTIKSIHKLTINFAATDVYVVARAKMKNPLDFVQGIRVQVLIDKKNVLDENFGPDLQTNEYRKTVFNLKDVKLYHIATKLDHIPHELTIISDAQGTETLEIFAIFFEHRLRVDG